jgi:UDP-N-acetylglucosamine:LPS N-acetylglucosamine transferase
MELLSAGASIIVDDVKDAKENAVAIKKALHTLVYDDELRTEMADAARAAGKPQAADQIAEEILCVISASSR